jgi:hypothetical protein
MQGVAGNTCKVALETHARCGCVLEWRWKHMQGGFLLDSFAEGLRGALWGVGGGCERVYERGCGGFAVECLGFRVLGVGYRV